MPAEGTTVVLCGQLIDGTGKDPVRDAAVVIEGSQIRQAGSRSRVKFDKGSARVIDAGERTVMPGLIDSHCHIFYIRGPFFGEPHVTVAVARAIVNIGEWLDRGVTTIRDVGTRENLDVGLREAVKRGMVRGSRLFVSGMGIAMTGGMSGDGAREVVIEVTGPEAARLAARQQLNAGVDLIKVFATAGVATNGVPQLTEDEMRAVCEEAHKVGKRVAIHALANEGVRAAVMAGADTIEHGTWMDEETVELMRVRGVAFVPTRSVYVEIPRIGLQRNRDPEGVENARRSVDAHRASLLLARDAGITIAAGTDPTLISTVAMECAELVEAGLTHMEALVAATRSGAEILGWGDRLGTIEAGKLADLIAIDGDPLEDIKALDRVDYVMLDGAIAKAPTERAA